MSPIAVTTPDLLGARFAAKVERGAGCWMWTGATNGRGYGQMTVRQRRVYAHRVAWELAHGEPIPDALWVLHRCDNPRCVNPDHLFLGTQRDNMQDALSKGRFANANTHKSHCKRGHPLSGENLYAYRGTRLCRTCRDPRSRGRD